jgi:WD repeat-containing protein 61
LVPGFPGEFRSYDSAETLKWLYSGGDDHRIVLHDVRAGSKTGAGGRGEGAVANMQGHQSWVLNVAASPDGKLLGSGCVVRLVLAPTRADWSRSADSTVKLWDVGARSCVSTSSTAGAVWAVEWQPEGAGTLAPGKQFAIAGDERAVTLYRAAGAV